MSHAAIPDWIHRSKTCTRSGGHAPSHGIEPFFKCSKMSEAPVNLVCMDHHGKIGHMRQAIGEVLALAIAAAISPFPIIGVVLMLVTPRARVNGPMFLVGWLTGLALIGAIGLTVASAAGASEKGAPSTTADVIQIVLGAGLILLAARQWRKRPKRDEQPATPRWMNAIEGVSLPKRRVWVSSSRRSIQRT
jgi:hypothetical protein